MNRLTFNSIDPAVFRVTPDQTGDGRDNRRARADIIAEGRLLFAEYARRGVISMRQALGSPEPVGGKILGDNAYAELNKRFQQEHLLYAAKRACESDDTEAPESFEEFRRRGQSFYRNASYVRKLAGIYQEIASPIFARVYSEAVSVFADMVDVGFGETYSLPVQSGDIPVFQDSAWGSVRSAPANRLYSRDVTLNPMPKTAEMRVKWTQMLGNNMDFGQFFSSMAAGMYAKTMAMWNKTLTAATAAGSGAIPAGLTGTFSQQNWVTLANKMSAVNNTRLGNIFATGNMVALSKVLPTQVTGSTNVNMDAAIAALLGADYTKSGYLGEYMGVRLLPLTDAVKPGTQFSTVETLLSPNDIWMLSASSRKPLAIAYNSATPLEIDIRFDDTTSLEWILSLTIALDSAAVFASSIAHITI